MASLDPAYHDMEAEFAQLHELCAPFTMTSVERMYALWTAVRHVTDQRIPGAIVECGVWRGGSSMLAAATLVRCGERHRELALYDTFAGMTDPGEHDIEAERGIPAGEFEDLLLKRQDSHTFAYASLSEVQHNMGRTGYPPQRISYFPGAVEDTLPGLAPSEIALLRLDTDWYESTRHELEHLWPRLVAGGVLIVDDYGHWTGARKAVDEYFGALPDPPLLCRIDYTGRLAVKR